MKKNIFFFIIGLIVAGSVGVYATIKIQANEIEYKDGTVESALNNLYGSLNNAFDISNVYVESSSGYSQTSRNVIISLNKGKYIVVGLHNNGTHSTSEINNKSQNINTSLSCTSDNCTAQITNLSGYDYSATSIEKVTGKQWYVGLDANISVYYVNVNEDNSIFRLVNRASEDNTQFPQTVSIMALELK